MLFFELYFVRYFSSFGYNALLLRLQLLCGIHFIPPCGVVLEIFGKPCEHGVEPFFPFGEVEDVMVLVFDRYHGCLFSEHFEGCEHLDAFSDGYVGVGIAMEEEQRGVDLMGIVERALCHIELAVGPRVFVGHAHFAI